LIVPEAEIVTLFCTDTPVSTTPVPPSAAGPAVPGTETSTVCAKLAVTAVSELSVTWQLPVPEQPPPDQPVNVEPESAAAVRVT
jgi:hypothetical protein